MGRDDRAGNDSAGKAGRSFQGATENNRHRRSWISHHPRPLREHSDQTNLAAEIRRQNLPALNEQLLSGPTNQLPMYAENAAPVVSEK